MANGMIQAQRIDHIGIAVESIAEQRAFYETVLGARFEGTENVAQQGVRVAFLAIGSGQNPVRLELLEPTSADSPIAKFIAKRGPGLHHIAYAVDDLDNGLARLKAEHLRLIDEAPRPGADQSRIAFLHPKTSLGVLTELCEPAK